MAYTQYPDQTFVIDMTQELKKWELFSDMAERAIGRELRRGKKIGIFVSSLAYAAGRICNDCGEIPRCDNCDVSVQYHTTASGAMYGLCPICKHQYDADAECQNCHGHDVVLYGVGAQQVQEYVYLRWWIDSVTVGGKYSNSLSKIKKLQWPLDDAQFILSTSMTVGSELGLEVDLVVVLDADRGLFSPDYQASRKTWLMLYQLTQQYHRIPVIIQSFKPSHSAIVHACNQNIQKMKEMELERREQFGYPPFAQMCVLHYKHEIEHRTVSTTTKLYQELEYLKQAYEYMNLEIWATPPSIFKKFGKYRYTIVMKWSGLREFMDIAYSKLKMRSRGFKVDWEPQALI